MTKVKEDTQRIATILEDGNYDSRTVESLLEDARRMADLSTPSGENGETDRLTSGEMAALIDEVCAAGGRPGLMLRTILETGIRVPELVALQVEDVLLEDRYITVRQRKSDRTREVPISASLADDFRNRIGSRKSGLLFQGSDGEGYSEQEVYWIIQATVERAGIGRHLGAQALRHVTANLLGRRGASLGYIQKVFGHTHSDATIDDLNSRFELELC